MAAAGNSMPRLSQAAPPLSPAGCTQIRSQPAPDKGMGVRTHGFRKSSATAWSVENAVIEVDEARWQSVCELNSRAAPNFILFVLLDCGSLGIGNVSAELLTLVVASAVKQSRIHFESMPSGSPRRYVSLDGKWVFSVYQERLILLTSWFLCGSSPQL
jgi:hypothetical protein